RLRQIVQGTRPEALRQGGPAGRCTGDRGRAHPAQWHVAPERRRGGRQAPARVEPRELAVDPHHGEEVTADAAHVGVRDRPAARAGSRASAPSCWTSSPIREARVTGEQTAWRAKQGTGRPAAQLPEEGADVVDQRDRLLHDPEVSAALEARPARDVVETLVP